MNGLLKFHFFAKKFVLDALGKTVDDEKFLVEKDNPEQRVLTVDGQEIRLGEFAGVRHGSGVFIKSDISSLVAASDFIGR
jgi:hypothetical protein